MKTRKNKLTNFLKIGILFFGISLLLWNCEQENLVVDRQVENSIKPLFNEFQNQFNKKDFEKIIPYKYEVDWTNSTKQYSDDLEINFYEFDLIYTSEFNPYSINKSSKKKYSYAYKLIVLEKEKHGFYIAKFFKEKEEGLLLENTDFSLNKETGYSGVTHLYDKEGDLVFAKHITKNENEKLEKYIDKRLRQGGGYTAEKYIEVCDTVRTHHYIDWYYYLYDNYGNIISVTFSHTTYAGYTDEENCYTKWIPDNGDGGLYGTGVGCDDFGECVSDIKEALIEEHISNSLNLTSEQNNWFNDWENAEAKENIENYLKEHVGTNEFENALSFAILAIEALMNNGEVDFEDQIINELTGKAKCVYDKLKELSTGFKNAIQKFDGEFPVAHLKFSIDNNLPNSTNAVTNNSGEHLIEISFNGNTMNQRTILGLVRTFAHETIHAELFRKVRSVNSQISINDFPGIYDYYRRYIKNWQHEQMAAHYRETIADILKEFDGNQHSNQFYMDLAWEGLHGTVAWNNLSNSERTRITNEVENYKSIGNKNCN